MLRIERRRRKGDKEKKGKGRRGEKEEIRNRKNSNMEKSFHGPTKRKRESEEGRKERSKIKRK
jgi:hypothetical protein